MPEKIPTALTVAGSDSGGGAGIQADLKTFAALGVHGLSVLTSVTAQNTLEVRAAHDMPEEFVRAQLDTVMEDMGCDAAKLGMLPNRRIAVAVAGGMEHHGIEKLVVDPVMRATSGAVLSSVSADVFREFILSRAFVVTPNIYEAETLSGTEIRNVSDMKTAAEKIHSLGAGTVVVKGGHLPENLPATDVFFDGETFEELAAEREDTKNTHGTGCAFSAAICAFIAKGMSVTDSVRNSKTFVSAAIRNSVKIGKGHGPLNLFGTTSYSGDPSSNRYSKT